MYAVILHAHQKLDKVARDHLAGLLGKDDAFPSYRDIIRFEGQNGPDATKLKNTPGEEQPWHFYDPYNPEDTEILEIIQSHYDALVAALKHGNRVRAAFEAAWLAHALVDGLTPAHHYPYEEELERLRGGESRHTRTTLRSRAIVKGATRRESIKKSIELIGPKGLLMNHTTFEGGAYTLILAMRSRQRSIPSQAVLKRVGQEGLVQYFMERARVVADLREYERFIEAGWTPKLAQEVRRQLIPEMIRMVTVAWYLAAKEAEA
jgi:hypothetical protein